MFQQASSHELESVIRVDHQLTRLFIVREGSDVQFFGGYGEIEGNTGSGSECDIDGGGYGR